MSRLTLSRLMSFCHPSDDVAYAWRLKNSGEKAWSEETTVAPGAAKNSKPVYKEHFAH